MHPPHPHNATQRNASSIKCAHAATRAQARRTTVKRKPLCVRVSVQCFIRRRPACVHVLKRHARGGPPHQLSQPGMLSHNKRSPDKQTQPAWGWWRAMHARKACTRPFFV